MKQSGYTRRAFMGGLGAMGSGAVLTTAAAGSTEPSTTESIKAAEKLMGADYTDTERSQMAETVEGMVSAIQRRRENVTLHNQDAPALVFDPRIPGHTYPAQSNTVRVTKTDISVPDKDTDIAFSSTRDQAHWIRTGKLSSARLTEIYLNRIETHGSTLENYITVTKDLARAQARKADSEIQNGQYKGHLHGIPYALKDLFDTKDIPTTWGAAPYKGRTPDTDATVTSKLAEAGGVLLGKTTLGALAYGDIWYDGITRNPWAPQEGSSGSSAGSASASVAGLCSFAIGTETLGSIISPSARCGATGLRPTFGRVSRTGAMALCWSLDKIGPICRTVEDTAIILDVLNGYDAADASSIGYGFDYAPDAALDDIRIGYDPAWFKDAAPADQNALQALKASRATMQEITLPEAPYDTLVTLLLVEAAAAFEELTLSNQDDLMKWQDANAWPNSFRAARFYSAVECMQLDRFRRQVMQIMHSVFSDVDVLISPNFAGQLLTITNFTGHPSLTLPVGFHDRTITIRDGDTSEESSDTYKLPHTITVWGDLFEERKILQVGKYIEDRMDMTKAHPVL